jgi:hypothetical protein
MRYTCCARTAPVTCCRHARLDRVRSTVYAVGSTVYAVGGVRAQGGSGRRGGQTLEMRTLIG